MANNLKPNTNGIDCEIKDIQVELYDAFVSQYSNVEGYGRVYKNDSDNGVIPEVFILSSNDYQDVYLDDRFNIMFGFLDSDNHDSNDGVLFKAGVKLFVWVNLTIFSDSERNDSEAQRLVVSTLKDGGYLSDTKVTVEKRVSNVFRQFNTDKLVGVEMHPFHLFSVNFDISYQLTKKCQ